MAEPCDMTLSVILVKHHGAAAFNTQSLEKLFVLTVKLPCLSLLTCISLNLQYLSKSTKAYIYFFLNFKHRRNTRNSLRGLVTPDPSLQVPSESLEIFPENSQCPQALASRNSRRTVLLNHHLNCL